MEEEAKAVQETAKAVQEVVKTTGQAIGAGEKLSSFVAPFIKAPLAEASGLVEDWLKFVRWERQARFTLRAKAVMAELGLHEPTRALPLNFAIPLLQAASVEEDDELQDIWVNLLINSADVSYDVQIRRAYISILQDLGSLEVKIMDTIYSRSDLDTVDGFWTRRLPDQIEVERPPENEMYPSPEVGLALDNLVRLNCLTSASMWDGPLLLMPCVYPTSLGKALYKACAHRPRKAQ